MAILYQPVINLANRMPVKLEAFYRPANGGGEVKAFIASTELSGGIKKLLEDSLIGALTDWPIISRPFLALSINASISNLDEPDLTKRVEKILKKYHFEPRNLWFELDEGIKSVDDPKRIARMKELSSVGIRFSCDSFGTEINQGTIYDLQRLPIGELKIDGRIVADADVNMEHRTEVKSTVTIAQQMRVAVSAKGIERPEIAAMMQRLGCTYGQGYLFARPVTAKEVGAVIDALR